MSKTPALINMQGIAHNQMLTIGTECAEDFVKGLHTINTSGTDTLTQPSFNPDDYVEFRAANRLIAILEDLEKEEE